MKTSIKTKLLIMCVLLVLLATGSLSIAYYIITKQDTHRESRQRIQIAFDIIFDDISKQREFYTQKFSEFFQQGDSLALALQISNRQTNRQMAMRNMLVSQLRKAGYITSANRLALYGADRQLLVEYYPSLSQEAAKIDWPEDAETPSPFPLAGGIPEAIESTLFSTGTQLGIRIIAPLIQNSAPIGVLVGDVIFAQDMVERYATLSKTEINFFAGYQYSLGTLSEQPEIVRDGNMLECGDMTETFQAREIFVASFGEVDYYQGKCSLGAPQNAIGAISVSLSQEIEKQEVRKILHTVLLISGVVIGIAFGLAVLFSRKTIQSLHDIVAVIGAAAEGDLRNTATSMTHDEVGMLADKLNQMIVQLRDISGQVQGAAYAVNGTADTILQQVNALILHMEQQSSSVDNTTNSMEAIHEFIDVVSHNTSELLTAAALILASIQETRASIAEVTISTGTLATNLQNIFMAVDQVNHTVKNISEHTGHLEEVAQRTETEIHHIDRSLQEVSDNADRSQQLAEETMEAATHGQRSVETSLEGIAELKEVVANTAHIIREVNSWGERVSAILGIVDEITEQTSLLALNASIISAQAGTHGRGFAVVADEIKELATRTKTSTQEIGMLIHELQVKTEEGVHNTEEGLKKAEFGMQLVHAVKDSLTTILERATHSSNRAADTAQLIQQTVGSGQTISTQVTDMTEMVTKIREALQAGEQEVEQIVVSVETISGMSEQVNRANLEQSRAAEEIEQSMMDVTEKFSDISEQTETLQQNVNQIVSAMHTIESTTGQILHNTTEISGSTVRNLIQQSEILQKIVQIFKVS